MEEHSLIGLTDVQDDTNLLPRSSPSMAKDDDEPVTGRQRSRRNSPFEPGAGSPRPIVPLGSDPEPAAPATPLDEWLSLLFD